MRGLTHSAFSVGCVQLITVHLTPSHVRLISINNTGRRLWQRSIELTRFGRRRKTLNISDCFDCEIRHAAAKNSTVFFYFYFDFLIIILIILSFFLSLTARPTRTAVPAQPCQAGRQAERNKESSVRENKRTHVNTGRPGLCSSRVCSGVTSPHVCGGTAGRVTMRWSMIQMWSTFLPAHAFHENRGVAEITWMGWNRSSVWSVHAEMENSREKRGSRERVANSAGVSVCHSELRCAWGHTEGVGGCGGEWGWGWGGMGWGCRGGGWGVDSIVFAAGDVILNQWRDAHEAKGWGASTLARACWRRRREEEEEEGEKVEKKIVLNRVLKWLYSL